MHYHQRSVPAVYGIITYYENLSSLLQPHNAGLWWYCENKLLK